MKISLIFSVIAILVTVCLFYVLVDDTNKTSKTKINLSFFPSISHVVPIIGINSGIFYENLGYVTIKTKLFESGPQTIESLFSNSIDVAYIGPGPTVNGFLKSEKQGISILSGTTSGGISFISHPKSLIFSISDFSGKRIAVPQIGNTQDVSLRNYLFENGLKSVEKGGTVYILNISNPDIYTLFTKGEIDGAWISEPWASILTNELGGTRLFYEKDLWPEKKFSTVLLIARTEYIQKNQLVIENLLDSHIRTISWINVNQDETKSAFDEFMEDTMGQSLTNEIIDTALSNIESTYDPLRNSIYVFAEREYLLGYLGRHGYDLNGIFYYVGPSYILNDRYE